MNLFHHRYGQVIGQLVDEVLGIEMLDVSQRTDNPRELAMELVGV